MDFSTELLEDCFTVIWKIRNFSMCVNKKGEKGLVSPNFIIDTFNKTSWQLELYPRGYVGESDFSCCLKRSSMDNGPPNITLACKFFTLPTIDLSCKGAQKSTFAKGGVCRWDSNSRKDIFKSRYLYLPDDTLTFQCRMWKCTDENSESTNSLKDVAKYLYPQHSSVPLSLSAEIYSVVSTEIDTLRKKLYPLPNRCEIYTDINVEKRIFTWKIKKFSELKLNQKIIFPVASTCEGSLVLDMEIYLSTDDSVKIDVRRQAHNTGGKIMMFCRIAYLDCKNNELLAVNEEKLFEQTTQEEVWQLPNLPKKTTILSKQDEYLVDGDLVFKCYFLISEGIDKTYIESSVNEPSKPIITKIIECDSVLGDDLVSIFEERKFTDITLKIGKVVFSAHKAILCARSAVFEAMFENEMSEKKSNEVVIPDTDADTFGRFLHYIYTGTVRELQYDLVMKLYIIADKYRVLNLRDMCSSLLIEKMSVENICEMLAIADLHHDEDFKKVIFSFVENNSNLVLPSEEWKALMKNNLQLAADTMYQMWIDRFGMNVYD